MTTSKHIAIVGAGLVGSLLSIYLRRRGYNVSVYERRTDMRITDTYAGRSINLALSTRGIKALEEVGLAEEIKNVAIPMHGRMMHDLQGNLTFQPYGKEGQFINSISRSNLNIVLMNEAERLGVKFFFEHRCVNVNIERTELVFTNQTQFIQPPAESLASATFNLIIGADGAFSAVRGAMQYTDRFDFSQDYIQHGYKELHIPAGSNGRFQLEKNALHIWPRESYMMIALPNPDGSFTCTLFFPFEGPTSFASLKSDADVRMFFEKTFPDSLKLMPTLIKDYNTNPFGSLVTMQCFPWVRNHTLLIGDAAHAMVPFYGQGMNAGFEDCRILNSLLHENADDWKKTLILFQELRKPDADAISQLALNNFVEMRDLVADANFLLRKKIESQLYSLYPHKWIPLYSMVTFHETIRYSEAYYIGKKQQRIMDEVMATPGIEEVWHNLDFEKIVSRLDDEA